MRVKVAIPLEKEIRRGAFLADQMGRNFGWTLSMNDCLFCAITVDCLGMNYGFVLSILAKQNLGLRSSVVMGIG